MAAFGRDYNFLAKRHLYVAAGGGYCKIGVSKKPNQRMSDLSSAQASDIELIKSWPKQGHLEPMAHEVLEPLRVRREWFKCEPEFGGWICEQLIAGLRHKAIKGVELYCEVGGCDIHSDRVRVASLEDELHGLGFETFGHRMKAAIKRSRESDGHKWIDYWTKPASEIGVRRRRDGKE
jgi:Meiotically up-regulated gene 113